MRRVYTTSTGAGNRIESKESGSTNKENHRANKEKLKALLISSMTIYVT